MTMKYFAGKAFSTYLADLSVLCERVMYTSNDEDMPQDTPWAEKIIGDISQARKLHFFANGGSASISSHMAVDFTKAAGIPAFSYHDPSLLTCLSNDLGYEHAFEFCVKNYTHEGDMLIFVSSSGESMNLINAIKAAKNQKTLTITSFNKDNTLGQLGHHNLYLETKFYGYAEIASLALLHFFLDRLVGENQ